MEIVVLSGKGGTGKTTIVAALSELAKKVVKVDCDVDAPNLYLLFQGTDIEKKDFFGGKKAKVNIEQCVHCNLCEEVCKFGAIKNGIVDEFICEGCGACTLVCPQSAIQLLDEKTADTYLTQTNKGLVSRAQMGIGSDGSGRLVTFLRKNIKEHVKPDEIIIGDGSPGIGCAVIASITGTDVALIVTEPTKSGLSDMQRILKLAEHFNTKLILCINKFDINLEMTNQIEDYAKTQNVPVVGKIPFDNTVMEAVNSLRPITDFENSVAKNAIEEMWIEIQKII